LFSGLFFIKDDVPEAYKYILMIIIMGLNIWFFSIWFYFISRASPILLIKKMGKPLRYVTCVKLKALTELERQGDLVDNPQTEKDPEQGKDDDSLNQIVDYNISDEWNHKKKQIDFSIAPKKKANSNKSTKKKKIGRTRND
jgi:hypothetical protein